MSDKIYTLREAASLLGWDYERLKTMARRNQVQIVDLPQPIGKNKKGIRSSVLADLQSYKPVDLYSVMLDEYLSDMRAGVWGRNRYITNDYINKMEASLKRYWSILDTPPNINDVSAANFKRVMASFKIDWDAKKDSYATKMDIYKAICALMKVLIKNGHKTKLDLADIKEHLPSATFLPKRDFLDLDEILEVLDKNKCWKNGRSKYDIQAMHILICLYAFAGLRRMEAANIRVDQVHLSKGYMHVYGKWAKERVVPIFPILAEALTDWLTFRAKIGVESSYLVPQVDGDMLTKDGINSKFRRLKEHINDERLTPHPLRRSCATIAAIYGMAPGLIQRMLGHKHASTTEGYKQVEDRHLVEWAQTFDFGIAKPAPTTTPMEERIAAKPATTPPERSVAHAEFW